MLPALRRGMILLALVGAAGACAQSLPTEPIRPLPEQAGGDPARIALGTRLFFDARFSRDNKQSCASCHRFDKAGTDGLAVALGADGKPGQFNTPTVYNSSFNFRQTWTGRHTSIEGLLDHVIARPNVFATSWEAVASRLAGDPALSDEFRKVYGDAISAPYVMDALGQFLRSLSTPSRFDRYLRGDNEALSVEEKAGYAKFKSFGCAACHQGINAGANMYQKFGAMRDVPGLRASGADLGRFEITGREADRHVFRVPGLRNVALTAPYFHNGSASTLEEAVDVMFKYQLGRSATEQDRDLIVRFLHTLSGEQLLKPAVKPSVKPAEARP